MYFGAYDKYFVTELIIVKVRKLCLNQLPQSLLISTMNLLLCLFLPLTLSPTFQGQKQILWLYLYHLIIQKVPLVFSVGQACLSGSEKN